MHDIDRTQLEVGSEELESDYEFEDQDEAELADSSEAEDLFSEAEEMELASELLEVTDEYELDQFLGGLLKRAKRKLQKTVGRVLPSSTLRALGGYLKSAARKALPGLATTLGTAVGGPFGGMIASKLAPLAGQYFGLELEGLSSEDQEFEVARRVVRLAGGATQQAAMSSAMGSPQDAAQQAVAAAASRHAPGFLRGGARSSASAASYARGHSGRWIRRGRRIVLLGV
jgi:hypothetical protein